MKKYRNEKEKAVGIGSCVEYSALAKAILCPHRTWKIQAMKKWIKDTKEYRKARKAWEWDLVWKLWNRNTKNNEITTIHKMQLKLLLRWPVPVNPLVRMT